MKPLYASTRCWVLLFTWLTFPLSLAVPTESSDEALEKTSELVVKIDGTLGDAPTMGGGIILVREKDKLFIATANHVVRRGEKEAQDLFVTLKTRPSESFPGVLLSNFDTKLDLAVVQIGGLEKENIDGCQFALSRVSESSILKRGSGVFAVGHPNGVSWFLPVTSSPVAHVMRDFINFETFILGKGHSGGGLLNEEGGLVGMIRADQAPFGQAVRLEPIMSAFEKWNYPVSINKFRVGKVFDAIKNDDVQILRNYLNADPCFSFDLIRIFRSDGLTPLQVASENGSVSVARFLLKHGANANVVTANQLTVLHIAIKQGSLEMVRTLLQAGADPKAKNGHGETPLQVATKVGSYEMIETLSKAIY